jgi:SanA protein
MRALMRYSMICVLIVVAILVAVPISMREAARTHVYTSVADAHRSDAVLVLGASIVQGKPSPVLERRAARAVELYRAGKAGSILVTGDNGEEAVDEVTPVRKYLLAAGVPAEDIFLDHAGFDTYSSMYRARHIYGARSVIIVTQDFHMPRALFIARRLGLEAEGFIAEGEGTQKDYVREVPASVKALIDVLLHRKPKYLGDSVSLDGDGSATWY